MGLGMAWLGALVHSWAGSTLGSVCSNSEIIVCMCAVMDVRARQRFVDMSHLRNGPSSDQGISEQDRYMYVA
ncbi:hypothetical protein B0J17DRAFT_660577 [Rhizoctonia solani]|nr:hypothetical protein B0J17DRAFT_660577 [Rhizoctonia solani]